ncbi:MAG: hypothetical protein DRP63_05760 [Planctomycetota bacterium]|nr:MAG: hypothetical protein DRP63_05760 [Planctomycetota bacterium]
MPYVLCLRFFQHRPLETFKNARKMLNPRYPYKALRIFPSSTKEKDMNISWCCCDRYIKCLWLEER